MDDELIRTEDTLLGDESEGRGEAFFKRLALARGFYMTAIEAAVVHARNRAADADVVPWVPFGARNIGGRIRALAQDPTLPAVMYAGTAQGGVFKTEDAGDTWAPLGGPEDAFPIGALAVPPNRPNVLYIGSGEPGITHGPDGVGGLQANEQFAAGRGFYRFDPNATAPTVPMQREAPPLPTDGTAPLPGSADSYARIVVDPVDHERCWLASHTGLWRREAGPVFHREQVPINPLPVFPAAGVAVSDVIVVPGFDAEHPNLLRVFAAVATVGVFRGVFDRKQPAAGVVWEPRLSDNLPAPSAIGALTWDRIRLGYCASFPQHVYIVAGNASSGAVFGAWHSRDGGSHWTPGATPVLGGQIWVNLYVEVHPDNPAIAIVGGVDLARSTDFGASWQLIINWGNFSEGDRGQHGDQHAALFDAADPRRLWVCNDGGVGMTPDIVQGNPRVAGNWRKRSHGLVGAQFNDIATHPSYPFMVGGGLQDNGCYVSFGGETWYLVGDADGGQMAFEVNDPRTFITPNQSLIIKSQVVAPTTLEPAPGSYPLVSRRIINGDLAPPADVFASQLSVTETAALRATAPLFVPLVEHHRSTAAHLLIGRGFQATQPPPAGAPPKVQTPADVFFSTDTLNTIGRGNLPALLVGGVSVLGTDDITALAYGNGAAAATDWWVGTNQGQLFRRPNAGANPSAWRVVNLPASALGLLISRIGVHPADERYVVVSACDATAPHQGRAYLTLDRGVNWAEITGQAAVGVPGVGEPALLDLPPSPITSLAFDPQPGAAAKQVLYVGTLAGVYVIRNLPERRTPPANAVVPAFNPHWQTFNGFAGRGLLPITLVKDIRIVSLPRIAAAPPSQPEAVARHRLIAAMYGRGMYVADITRGYPAQVGAGGPEHRLYLRQTVVEDGMSYPRPAPAQLNAAPGSGAGVRLGGDPRTPLLPTPTFISDREAFDIRIDNAAFQFFDGKIDGVEFDEDLRTKTLRPGELNVIYVQAHTRGWKRALVVDVHLYFALAPDPGAAITLAVANAAPLPDLQADFWQHWEAGVLPPPVAATNPPRAVWQRVATSEVLFKLAPNQPEVARFEWVPPVALAGQHVALLALVSSIFDPMPANPPTVMATLIRNERRAAFRVVRAEPFVPEVFIRDGLDDDGRLGGVAYGGRSPDIIVVAAAAADPAEEFKDIGHDRAADRVRGNAGANVVYVRVHNRKSAETAVDVELFWALPNFPVSAAPGQPSPPFNAANWQVIAPVDAVNITVPAKGSKLARFDFSAAPAPEADIPNSIAFIALIKSHDGLDPEPVRTEVDTQPEFWRLFLERANSNNAALRALRYA